MSRLNLKRLVRDRISLPLRNSIRLALGLHPIEYRKLWPDVARIPLNRGDVLIDAGAHVGTFTGCALAYQPWLRVHAFEPIPEACEELSRRFGGYPGLRLNRLALGRCREERSFNVSRFSEASSFFAPGEELLSHVYGHDYATARSILVNVETLDSYCTSQGIARIRLLKLDVQGSEIEVLEGAASMLDATDYVYAEAQFRELYRGAPRYDDTFRYLHKRNFDLLCMTCFRADDAGELMECDMIFRRRSGSR